MSEEKLLCPIGFLDGASTDTYCLEERCAWWAETRELSDKPGRLGCKWIVTGGHCAVHELVSIADELKNARPF